MLFPAAFWAEKDALWGNAFGSWWVTGEHRGCWGIQTRLGRKYIFSLFKKVENTCYLSDKLTISSRAVWQVRGIGYGFPSCGKWSVLSGLVAGCCRVASDFTGGCSLCCSCRRTCLYAVSWAKDLRTFSVRVDNFLKRERGCRVRSGGLSRRYEWFSEEPETDLPEITGRQR